MKFVVNNNSQFKARLEIAKQDKRLGIHSFHRYYGKLIPAIPSAAIEQFTKPGDIVFDPFSGSGTTAVEAVTRGRNFIGFEINPLSLSIAKTKTTKLDVSLLEKCNADILELIRTKTYDIDESDYPSKPWGSGFSAPVRCVR